MSINRNFSDLASSASAKSSSGVGDAAKPTDLVQKLQLDSAFDGAAANHNHDGVYAPASFSLDALSDVIAAGAVTDQVIVFRDGQGWVLENGADVFANDPVAADGYVLDKPPRVDQTADRVYVSNDSNTVAIAGREAFSLRGPSEEYGYIAIYERVGATFQRVAGIRPPDNVQIPGETSNANWALQQYGQHAVAISPDGSQILVTAYRRGDYSNGPEGGVWIYNRSGASWAARGMDEDNTQYGAYDAYYVLQDKSGVDIPIITTVDYCPTLINGKFRFYARSSGPTNVSGQKVTGIYEISVGGSERPPMVIEIARGLETFPGTFADPADQNSSKMLWSQDGSRIIFCMSRSGNSGSNAMPFWLNIVHAANTAARQDAVGSETSRGSKAGRTGFISSDGNCFITCDNNYTNWTKKTEAANYRAYIWFWNGATYTLRDTLIWGQDYPLGRSGAYVSNPSDSSETNFDGWTVQHVNSDGTEIWAGGFDNSIPKTVVFKYVWNGSEYVETTDVVYVREGVDDAAPSGTLATYTLGSSTPVGTEFISLRYQFFYQGTGSSV